MTRSEKGFTLLEVLAAMAIAGIALTIIIQLFSAGLRSLRAADETMAAAAKADEKMRSLAAGQLYGGQSWSETTEDGYRIDYAVSKAFEDRTTDIQAGLQEIRLTLHYMSGTREKTLTLSTLRAGRREQ